MRLPMFPIGSVLFPHQLLPLHVFEPRYRTLVTRCLDGDRRFGVVLIERGSEVGGGDVRFDAATAAEIVEAAPLPDGRWLLEVLGRERVHVDEWLADDPHPWADVSVVTEDAPPDAVGPGAAECADRLRRLLALRAELGEPAPPATVDLDDDPLVRSWQVCILAAFNPMDALELLRTRDAFVRLALLRDLLDSELLVAEARL